MKVWESVEYSGEVWKEVWKPRVFLMEEEGCLQMLIPHKMSGIPTPMEKLQYGITRNGSAFGTEECFPA